MTTEYTPRNGWIEGRNRSRFSNRYIYEGNCSVYIMAGDRPLLRLAERRVLLGTLRLSYKGKPLEDFSDILMRYRPGRVQWILSDTDIGEEITLDVTSPGDGLGLILKAETKEEISFVYGGIRTVTWENMGATNPLWNLTVRYTDKKLKQIRFLDEWLEGNTASLESGHAVLSGPDSQRRIYISSDRTVRPDGRQATGTFRRYFGACLDADIDLEQAYLAGCARSDRLACSLQVNTPDEYINAAAAAAAAEVDGSWHPPKTMHGNMSWSMPYVGWQVHYGHHMLGDHDRSKQLLKAYAAAQNQSDEKSGYAMNESMTLPAENSRFYGKGHIDEDQHWYNMQTQFFHQMISAWRFSGDEEFEETLRKMLALHLEWEEACFDPDGTGAYASVVNTWPTDSVSYSDGPAVEETCYAYTAHRAMAQLTAKAGMKEEAAHHQAKAAKIKEAFFRELWIKDKGYPATYRDRGGRLHEEAWIYSSFMPVECDLLDPFEQAQALYYPQWAYERGEDGGFWFSNWTPGIWSVRENAGGENMQQACAFLKGGKEKDALEIIQSTSRAYLNSDIPGELMHPIIETAHQYTRVMVEGLFGYRPDYPSGRVTVAPMLPFEWKEASIQTKDVSIEWRIGGIRIVLKRSAYLTIRMKLFADRLISVKGVREWHLEPGIGGMFLVMHAGYCDRAEIELELEGERDWLPVGDTNRIPTGNAIFNPQGVDACSSGEHVVFEKTKDGYYREIHVHLGPDPQTEALRMKQQAPLPEHPVFETVDLTGAFNADVQDIFRNEYLSPRPSKGCYAQIGKDGYSFWTFPFWGIKAPEVILERTGPVQSDSGIPFEISGSAKNILFTSRWDNFPDCAEAALPGREAEMAAVLIAGSTNPMQCGIENGRLTFLYEDGSSEDLPLVNPDNYIMLCPYHPRATSSASEINRSDVFNPIDRSLMKHFTPEIIDLGQNLRALSIRWPLPSGRKLRGVRLTACSNDVVIGLMGITLIRSNQAH